MQEKAVAESKMQSAEAERLAAVDQLNIFTQSLLEKMQLIEKMELTIAKARTRLLCRRSL
ncbi:MAG: hypothetical protein WKG06_22170 [Segetibacter sp.]